MAQTDVFTYSYHLEAPEVWTKRAVLSLLSRPYDPSGFIAPFLLMGRILYQEVCKKHPQCNWNDELPKTDLKKFEKWLENTNKLSTISIARCLRRHQDEDPGLHEVPWFEHH